MRFLIGITAVLLLPSLAAADIKSSTSASSESGGNYAGPGGTVHTGSASASVSTSNVSGSSSSTFYIKTDAGGVVREESHTSGSADVHVSVQATPDEVIVETREGSAPAVRRVTPAQADTGTASSAAATTTQTDATSSPAGALGLGTQIVLTIQSFFAGLFGWFR